MIRRLLQSTAMVVALSFLPMAMPEVFIYKSLHAEEGPKIPAWISAACCGPQDSHKLRADQVYRTESGAWHADGYPRDIPNGESVRPSQDGSAWAFYNEHTEAGGVSGVYCLFWVPSI